MVPLQAATALSGDADGQIVSGRMRLHCICGCVRTAAQTANKVDDTLLAGELPKRSKLGVIRREPGEPAPPADA
jgi:hypothetical protein